MKHEFKLITEKSGTCGDHYCSGHTDFHFLCSCGEKIRYASGNKDSSVALNKVNQIAHILEAEGIGKIHAER